MPGIAASGIVTSMADILLGPELGLIGMNHHIGYPMR
jgi:hypothetical protein